MSQASKNQVPYSSIPKADAEMVRCNGKADTRQNVAVGAVSVLTVSMPPLPEPSTSPFATSHCVHSDYPQTRFNVLTEIKTWYNRGSHDCFHAVQMIYSVAPLFEVIA